VEDEVAGLTGVAAFGRHGCRRGPLRRRGGVVALDAVAGLAQLGLGELDGGDGGRLGILALGDDALRLGVVVQARQAGGRARRPGRRALKWCFVRGITQPISEMNSRM
jgi:hypothetical protein